MAGIASFFCPGLGHLIHGRPFQAILWFLLVLIGYFALIVPGIILHLLCILDASRLARMDAVEAVQEGFERAMRNRRQ